MALRFAESFDNATFAQLLRRWTTMASGSISSSGGRRGTGGLVVNGNTAASKILDAQATWIIGFDLNYTQGLIFGSPSILSLQDGLSNQVDILLLSDGRMQVRRAGTALGTTTVALKTGSQYLEFKCTISDAAGAYELRLNGVNVLSASSVDTKNTANATADRFFIFSGNGINSGVIIDDLYVCDGTGAANNDFLGDIKVASVLPTGAGANTGLTPSTGSNFQNVDDATANDDTDYNEHATVGNKDTYDMTNLPGSWGSIKGVQISMVARKDDAGARSICSVTRSGGTDYDGTAQALSTTFSNYFQILEQDPATAAAWANAAAINSAEFGMKVQA